MSLKKYCKSVRKSYSKVQNGNVRHLNDFVARQTLSFSQLVKASVFKVLADSALERGDYISAAIEYYYSLYHSSVAIVKLYHSYAFDRIKEVGDFKTKTKPTKKTSHREVKNFLKELSLNGLISKQYVKTLDFFYKRRNHVNYQPRTTLHLSKQFVFYSCQYPELPNDIDLQRQKIEECIEEVARFLGITMSCACPHWKAHLLWWKIAAPVYLSCYRYWGTRIEYAPKKSQIKISNRKRKSCIPINLFKRMKELLVEIIDQVERAGSK